jgi:zinc protease
MKKITFLFSAFLAFGFQIKSQITAARIDADISYYASKAVFIDEVKKVGNEIVIPYKRYQLANGLTILIHEDHSDPICYVDVTYHVGSAREQQGRSGFAHFFEHMMFQGSKHVADDQHFKIITEAGGTLNGTTNTDRTNYFETVPSNQLEKMLWLEADRMGFLLDSVTQKKFEVQRATVKNERGQRYDNAPYGLVGEKIGEALYPQGHPYSWTTIGYIVDLDRVDVNDLKRFYLRWYGPNNAVLTVAGDVNTQEVLAYAQKYFGSIAKGPEVKEQIVKPFTLAANRYISYEDNVKFPMINIAFPTVKANTADDAALDVLASVLAGSQGSPFYKGFIESKKAVSANVYQYSRELAGQFQIVIRANATSSLSEIETEVYKVLADWEKKGVTEDDLIKFKAQFQSELYNQLSTVQGKGATLASYYTLTRNANNLKNEIQRYLSVKTTDVMRVYNTYIKNKSAVILSCLPKTKGDMRAKPDNWKMYDRLVEAESAEYKNTQYTEPKDDFVRSNMPTAKPAAAVPVPNYYDFMLSSGIPIIGVYDNDIPKVNILISLKAGHRFEAKEKSGLAVLLSALLKKSTLKTSAEEIENKLDRLGSSLQINAGDEEVSINIESLKQNLDATLKIVEEVLFEPKFDEKEFELVKKQQLDGITQQQTNAAAIADLCYRKILYGDESIMGTLPIGNAETVNSILLSDVKNYYNGFNSQNITVSIGGDIKKEEVDAKLKFLGKFKRGEKMQSDNNIISKLPDPTKIYFIDKKNAAQSEIRMGYLALPYEALGEFYKATIMNFCFAGSFNSHINYLLREIKGWTYGTRGSFSGSKYIGPYTISGGFKANTTDSSLVELLNEIKKYNENGITEAELSFTKNAMMQSDALKYESPLQKLYFIKRVLDYDLPRDFVAQQTSILNNITKGEIDNLAKRYLPLNAMMIIVVGDKASNFEKVKKLGYEVVELDTNGKKIN